MVSRRVILALCLVAVACVAGFACVAAAEADSVDDLDVDIDASAAAGSPPADTATPAADEEELEDENHDVDYNVDITGAVLLETFQTDPLASGRVIKSNAEKYLHQMVHVSPPKLFSGIAGDKGLTCAAGAKHYGMAMEFEEPLVLDEDDDFVLQYEVRLQDGLECGGAYLKVPAAEPQPDLQALDSDTPYIVMFGPDKCGATNKVHFILRHQNPVTGEWSEHHAKAPPMPKSDKHSHLYTLHIRSDNTFDIKIDNAVVLSGDLLKDLEPPINPPQEIDDPEDEKPDDWVDEAKIADPEASKPDDWDEDAPATILDMDANKPEGWLDDEPEYVDDPEAEKPEEWDDEDDGEWEAPQVPNPKCDEAPGCGEWVRPSKANPEYKGKWSAPMIDNPDYLGEWAPRKIPNAAYFEDENPHQLPAMAGVAVEIWTMSPGLFFDNVLVTRDAAAASDFAQDTWAVKHAAQVAREEKVRAKIARKQREEAFRDGGIMGKLNYYLLEGIDMAVQNPIPTAVTIAVVLFALVYLCCFGDSPQPRVRAPKPTYRTPKTAVATEDVDDDADADADADADEDADVDDGDADAAAPEEPADEAEAEAEADAEPEADGSDEGDEEEDEDEDDDDDEEDDDEEEEPAPAPAVRKRNRRRKARMTQD